MPIDSLDLARWQFGVTTAFHFLFVPLTIGLAFLVAIIQTAWHRTGDVAYLRMTRFWGKLLLINFALGVVTGIVLEFQFGMNWSSYSRFVGDVFGAPLAIEGIHLATIWIVAFGTTVSAFFILAANSWMQHPVGYRVDEVAGRAELVDFLTLLANPTLWIHFPHTILAAFGTAAFFMLGISAYHLLRGNEVVVFRRSATIALVTALLVSVGVAFTGHLQAQVMTRQQPMKMAASEALWETERGAGWSLFAIGDVANIRNHINVQLPHLLSVLSTNTWNGEVKGINDIQREYEELYGPGSYVPVVGVVYWSFRVMVGAGLLMIALSGAGLVLLARGQLETSRRLLAALLPAISLPYVANTTGWVFTEMGRQPWIVFGMMRTSEGVSPAVGVGFVATTLVGFSLIYLVLSIVDVYLLSRSARAGPEAATMGAY